MMFFIQELSQSRPTVVCLRLQDELTGEQTTWQLLMATTDAVSSLTEALKTPWEREFQVNLQVITGP